MLSLFQTTVFGVQCGCNRVLEIYNFGHIMEKALSLFLLRSYVTLLACSSSSFDISSIFSLPFPPLLLVTSITSKISIPVCAVTDTAAVSDWPFYEKDRESCPQCYWRRGSTKLILLGDLNNSFCYLNNSFGLFYLCPVTSP